MEAHPISKRQQNRAKRKEGKAKSILMRHENIKVSDTASKKLYISNAGIGNGLSREHVYAWLSPVVTIDNIIMIERKPYCFVVVNTTEEAVLVAEMSGEKVNHEGIDQLVEHHIYFISELPCLPEPRTDLPEGLYLLPEFISESYEAQLLALINWDAEKQAEYSVTGSSMKHRSVKHFGYEFKYTTNNVSQDEPLEEGIPSECGQLLERLISDGYVEEMPDQLTVNKYDPGQGIPPHVDTHSAFRGPIVSLSLGSQVVMTFSSPDGDTRQVTLPRRSILVMTGASRYLWSHGIVPRKTDVIHTSEGSGLTLSYRQTRVSFTFRRLRRAPCDCAYPQQCDSQSYGKSSQIEEISDDVARKLESIHVHKVYDTIASHFSGTRHSQWPRVSEFIQSQTPGSIMADIGCGNGKYLTDNPNPHIYKMGFERSWDLSAICQTRGFPITQSDCLATPLRDGSVDVCLCIAVIHHLSTESRRRAAIRELVRILRIGGQCLIYVWAMEQKKGAVKSSYLKTKDDDTSNVEYMPTLEGECQLPVHRNKTEFASTDMLVPWNLKSQNLNRKEKIRSRQASSTSDEPNTDHSTKSESAPDSELTNQTTSTCNQANGEGQNSDTDTQQQLYHRYYHIFREGELETMCRSVDDCEIVRSYYDQGNWCIILRKTAS